MDFYSSSSFVRDQTWNICHNLQKLPKKKPKTNLSPKWLYKDINQTANNNNHLKMSKKQTSN